MQCICCLASGCILALQKKATTRTAVASAVVHLNDTAFDAISADGLVAKGNVLTVAQLAGRHSLNRPKP